jgi:hypothetical protein
MTTRKDAIDDSHLWVVLRQCPDEQRRSSGPSYIESSHKNERDAQIYAEATALKNRGYTFYVLRITTIYTPVTTVSIIRKAR